MHKGNPRGVHRVALSYSLSLSPSAPAGDLVLHPLIEMLDAVERRGSISAAARTLGLSYRHVWGELKRWEESFGRLLIVWEKGQKARLSGFGVKLLWAERQAQSRLAPQIQQLRSDLERAFAVAFDDQAQLITIAASHDEALSACRESLVSEGLHLDIRFSGSLDAIAALQEGRTIMAGFHLPLPRADLTGVLSRLTGGMAAVAQGLNAQAVPFAIRTQGLLVERGNPLRLRSLHDLLDGPVRFVNRPPGAGTRAMMDAWLDELGISSGRIRGWRHEEPSHAAVAQAIRAGEGDAGLGLEAVAEAKGLGFVPLYEEQYWLAHRESDCAHPAVQALLTALGQAHWRESLAQRRGYRAPEQMAARHFQGLLGGNGIGNGLPDGDAPRLGANRV
ncbi:MAG: LysR family transcriptional regulator [Proteobacteria bacterium]|nr:LysR family transcriptional regulator [Pseudomonadota bacterium]